MDKNERESHGRNILNNTEWKASFLDVKVRKILETGDVVESILKHAENNDIVVMGIGKNSFSGISRACHPGDMHLFPRARNIR